MSDVLEPDNGNDKEEIRGHVQEEDWSHLMTSDLSGGSFGRHDVQSITLPCAEVDLEIASTASLSPLDMMDLSWGKHDATGHRVWMGAELFLHGLPRLQAYFGGRRILELGTGTGLAGIAVVKSSASPMTVPELLVLTDNSESALELCRRNCERNQVANCCVVEVENLEWGRPRAGPDSIFDTVVATDVLYDIELWEPMLETTAHSLRPKGHFILSQVPRAALPPSVQVKPGKDYQTSLEDYLVSQAQTHGLTLLRLLRPTDFAMPQETLHEMVQAGASILIFEKTSCKG